MDITWDDPPSSVAVARNGIDTDLIVALVFSVLALLQILGLQFGEAVIIEACSKNNSGGSQHESAIHPCNIYNDQDLSH